MLIVRNDDHWLTWLWRLPKSAWLSFVRGSVRWMLGLLHAPKVVRETRDVLVLRLDGIGDSIVFSGCLPLIKERYGDCRLSIVVRDYVVELFRSCPFVDEVIPWDGFKFSYNPVYRFLFLSKLCRREIEILLYPMWTRTEDADDMCTLLKARRVYGFESPSSKNLHGSSLTFVSPPADAISELNKYVHFIRSIGIEASVYDIAPRVWTRESDRSKARESVTNSGTSSFIAAVPGAGSRDRIWELEKWIGLMKRILETTGWDLILLGGLKDIETCDNLWRGVNHRRVINMAGLFDLPQLAEVLKLARLCIGSETGAIHMAAAVGTPTLCIMGGGHFGRFFPYGDLQKNRIVFSRKDCYYCDWKCIYESTRCVDEISLDSAWKGVSTFIKDLDPRSLTLRASVE